MTTAAGKPVNGHANITNGNHDQVSAWHQPGPAAYDFRSDTMTTPTLSMLHAISNTTLLDDVVLEDPTTNALEAHVASLTGHEAALLVMSGTMGNQVALRTHLVSPPFSVLCDHRCHIVNYEAGGLSMISGAQTLPLVPSNGHHLTLEDIQAHAVISDDVHACPTAVISLENTLNGTVNPLSNLREIFTWARSHGIKMHLDGARIWEVASSTHPNAAGSLSDFCTLFDSVSLCFSKGLGAPIGSVIVGSKSFITRARRFRKMLGGGTRQAGVISAAARVAVDETFGSGPNGEGGKLRVTHERALQVAQMWLDRGGELTSPTETNMVWLDLEAAGIEGSDFVECGKKHGLKFYAGRIVVHYQIKDEAIEKLGLVMDEVLAAAKAKTITGGDGKKRRFDQYSNGEKAAQGQEKEKKSKADDADELSTGRP
jgi:threonine aldolase